MQQIAFHNDFPELTEDIAALLPSTVAVAATDPTEPRSAAFAQEAACLPPMRALRRREFLAGRHALRRAMAQLGHASVPVPMNDDRSPRLPQGLAASISHTGQVCVAIADHDTRSAGLGIDLEPDAPLDPALWNTICTRQDHLMLSDHPKEDRGHLARLIFCAKEAAYKCQFALSRTLLDFDDFDISLASGGQFEAVFRKSVSPFSTGDRLSGCWCISNDHIVAAAHIPA